MSEKTISVEPSDFTAFKFGEIGKALTPSAFQADCECGKRLFLVTGFGLSIDIPKGMDLISVCGCGKAYSIVDQTKRVQAPNESAEAKPKKSKK